MSVLSPSEEHLAAAASQIRAGALVAFPTETVYGLGGNALMQDAAQRIFAVKGRPPTDPLICHVPSLSDVAALWDQSTAEAREVVELGLALGAVLWPGPVTLVAKASAAVAPCVTGGSGFVGVRIPDHPVALEFLRMCGVPVAAPSANVFGHVSPTTAAHVLEDLGARDPELLILDGGCCRIGIESTVVRLHSSSSLEVLRRGKVSVPELEAALRSVTVGSNGDEATTRFSRATVSVRDTRSKYRQAHAVAEPMDGPGQLLTHYSPNIPCFLVTPMSFSSIVTASTNTTPEAHHASPAPSAFWPSQETSTHGSCAHEIRAGSRVWSLCDAAVIDFNGLLRATLGNATSSPESKASTASNAGCCSSSEPDAIPTSSPATADPHRRIAGYRSLSDAGCLDEACRGVFDALRWVEKVKDVQVAVFPLLSEWIPASDSLQHDELLAAVEDRLFRAASGVVCRIVCTPVDPPQ